MFDYSSRQYFLNKGTDSWDFYSEVILPKVPCWSPDSWSKAVSNIDLSQPKYSTFKVLPGHCSKFGYALWATAVISEWCHTVKTCDNFCGMGYSAGFTYALWAIVQDLVMHYGPKRQTSCHSIKLHWSYSKSLLCPRKGSDANKCWT
jgi:hypothetical protein